MKMEVTVTQSCLFAIPWSIQSMQFSRPKYWSGQPFPSPGDLPNPGIEPRSPALQADSLPAEPQQKLKNTGVGSLSLLQWIFPTQELNLGLLHCRRILYQQSYKIHIYLFTQYMCGYIYFQAHNKTEWEIQSSHISSAPSYRHGPFHHEHPTLKWYILVITEEPTLHIIINQVHR